MSRKHKQAANDGQQRESAPSLPNTHTVTFSHGVKGRPVKAQAHSVAHALHIAACAGINNTVRVFDASGVQVAERKRVVIRALPASLERISYVPTTILTPRGRIANPQYVSKQIGRSGSGGRKLTGKPSRKYVDCIIEPFEFCAGDNSIAPRYYDENGELWLDGKLYADGGTPGEAVRITVTSDALDEERNPPRTYDRRDINALKRAAERVKGETIIFATSQDAPESSEDWRERE